MKRTKIIATIGPASSSKETLKKMIEAGMNIARINFSHGTHESNGKLIDYVKELKSELNVPVEIIADLQGPRIRIIVERDLNVKEGEKIIIGDIFKKPQAASSKQQAILLDCSGVIENIEVSNEILIEDGKIRLKVVRKENEFLEAEVIIGGTIKNHKGVNIPGANLDIPILTEKDLKDLKFALGKNVNWIALSFVSRAKDLEDAREKIKNILGRQDNLPGIVPKIERKEAIDNIDEIVSASDMVMVARGDLGIELPESEVLIHQKEIIGKCIKAGKPVIVATQMLNSMIENAIPTRAEVADVSNAVIDHADAVMLSGESADGKYPVEAVAMMSKIIEDTEASPFDDNPPALLESVDYKNE